MLCCPTGHGEAPGQAVAANHGACRPSPGRPAHGTATSGARPAFESESLQVRVCIIMMLSQPNLNRTGHTYESSSWLTPGRGRSRGNRTRYDVSSKVCLPAAGVRRDERVELHLPGPGPLLPVVRLLNLYYPLHWHWPR